MFSKYIFILILFFTLIFVISELFNLLDKYTTDFAIKSLLTNDLKWILKYRGIKYKNVFEKQELINLIKETGEITKHEYNTAKIHFENEGKCNLTSVAIIPYEDLFNELVEDSKDSAWILKTILPKSLVTHSDDYNNKLDDVWCHIQSIYGKYGINMAVLDCRLLYNLCWNRGFHKSPFVLVLPRGRVKIKDSVDFFVFPYSTDILKPEPNSLKKKIVEWLRKKIAHRINHGSNINDFPVHFVSVYSNKSLMEQTPPTSISAHSVKFTGRIHFWSGTSSSIPSGFKEKINRKFPNWSPPGHFFINKNDLIYQYGIKEGQSINYEALDLFFRDLCPNSNDVFLWILFVINVTLSFHVAMKNVSFALQLCYFIWYFLIFNIIYCTIFLSLLSFLNISKTFDDFIQFLSFIWQKLAICSLFEHVRYLQFDGKMNFPLCFVVWLLFVCFIRYVCKDRESEPTEPSETMSTNDPTVEPWDPESGQQIAFISSLGNFNLFLQQQPPLYLTKLLNWTFQAPQKWAVTLAKKCKDNNNNNNNNKPSSDKINSNVCDGYSAGEHATSLTMSESHNNEVQWPPGYIFARECCICLGNFRQNEMLCGLPCGHAFHDSCIKKWLTDCGKDDCPQCRWPAYKEKS